MAKPTILKIKAVELALILYIIITGIILIAGINKVSQPATNIIIRVSILVIIWLFALTDSKNHYIKTLRLFTPILVLTYFYAETDYLNNLIFNENFDPILASIESSIFGNQPSLHFSEILASNIFAELMYFGYFSYYLLIIGLPILIFIKNGFLLTEKIIFITIHSFLIYYLIFIIFPSSGPQYYFDNGLPDLPKGYLFGSTVRLIQLLGEAPTAAFPSSHVSISLMLVFMSYKYHKKFMKIAIPIAILLIFSTVYIKAHYVIDVLAAFIITPLIYFISDKLFGYFNLILKQNDNRNP